MRWVALVVLLAACTQKPQAAAAPLQKPVPLEPLIAERVSGDAGVDSQGTYTVKPFTFVGSATSASALNLNVAGERLTLAGESISLENFKTKLGAQAAVVLAFDDETYLAQVLKLLALLDDANAELWLRSPDVPGLGWRVTLRDEANFNAWLEEPAGGKLRIVQRSDGFELQTNMGKLAGGDPKGPTVPTRGGSLDLVTLQNGLLRIKQRFTQAPDVCFMPTYGTTMHNATRAVAANWLPNEKRVFDTACLVYPRPAAPDSGR